MAKTAGLKKKPKPRLKTTAKTARPKKPSSSKTVYQKHPSVLYRKLGDDLQLIHLEGSFTYVIDGLAIKIWLALDGQTSVQKIIEKVFEEAGLEGRIKKRFQKDSTDFLKTLANKNLIFTVA